MVRLDGNTMFWWTLKMCLLRMVDWQLQELYQQSKRDVVQCKLIVTDTDLTIAARVPLRTGYPVKPDLHTECEAIFMYELGELISPEVVKSMIGNCQILTCPHRS